MDVAVAQRLRTAHSRFYLSMAIVFLAVGLTGFSSTFFKPLHAGTLSLLLRSFYVHVQRACSAGSLFSCCEAHLYTRKTRCTV